ncbi:hypothetical protein RND81_01G012600 [Saponaria officinalis]|uniref:Uncharacterized protein n=1 Tax=Saponaria officinalis TaxID=3572 RepID=A0AAW1N543_SAPOF
MNLYGYNPEIYPNLLGNQQNNDPFTFSNQFTNFSEFGQQDEPQQEQHCFGEYHLVPFDHAVDNLTDVPDIPDTCFNYITTLLRENDSEDRPGVTLHDYMTAQISYNRSLDAALLGELPSISSNHCLDDYLNMFNSHNNNNIIIDNNVVNVDVNVNVASVGNGNDGVLYQNCENNEFNGLIENNVIEEQCFGDFGNEIWGFDESMMNNVGDLGQIEGNLNMYSNTLLQNTVPEIGISSNAFVGVVQNEVVCNDTTSTCENSRGKRRGEENDDVENRGDRSVKQTVVDEDWCEQIEKYGEVLLCPEGRNKPGALCGKSKLINLDDPKVKVSRKRGSKGQVADLRTLLTRCAQCVARVDLTGAYELLKQIRENSSPYGDFLQRVAHYLANGLEARLEGKGSDLTRANEHISSCEVLKANRVFVGSVPFKIMSYYTTNKTIATLAMESSSIHIIDFGIYYGLQWPCIIQNLSKRPNGPPKIRITGVDFPQRGFRPSERVGETGRCLAMYCEKYNVPFEYKAIAQQWETIKVEDFNIIPNEPLVVNCLYRSHNLFDESIDDNSPRDAFLRLVRKIKPDMFMHGVVNSTSSVPFFLNRFKEVMFHYSALFDVFESTMSREDNERMLLESKLYGNQALNVIACEGVERVERPETYKQWQVRTQRAGFEQVAMDRDLVRRAKAMVKRSFRDEFSYDEDGLWVVQGWKGRILYAISCWKPV